MSWISFLLGMIVGWVLAKEIENEK